MTSLVRTLVGRREPQRSSPWPTIGLDDFAAQLAGVFGFGGLDYPYISTGGTLAGNEETIDGSFAGYAQGAYKRNGIIFACERARLALFTEARFQFRQMRNGKPGDLFGTQDLAILEQPDGPGTSTTTGDMLARMLLDADLAGNWYGWRRPNRVQRLRPDWTTIILGSSSGSLADVQKLGYSYQPGGPGSGERPISLLVEEVAHFAPSLDPEAEFRGMSWLTPVLREVMGDNAATTHKQKFFEQGATPNLVVSVGDGVRMDPQAFSQWVDVMEGQHAGVMNAYKTLYLASGADAKVIGSDMKQIDFKATQGAGETRIAAAAGVHPAIVGLSEGLQGSSLNSGNFTAAKRLLADLTMRNLWRNACGSLATIVKVPASSALWYDASDIPFLKDDQKDASEIQNMEGQTIRTLTDGGFTPESVVAAVTAQDWSRLEHTGLLPVQQQAPGESANSTTPAADAAASSSGRELLTAHLNGRTA